MVVIYVCDDNTEIEQRVGAELCVTVKWRH